MAAGVHRALHWLLLLTSSLTPTAMHGHCKAKPPMMPSSWLCADYFRTMVVVMDHLHQMGVMHRDIKPENFLLTTADDTAAVKLADFGLSTYFKPGQRFSQIVGSAYYVAPEVMPHPQWLTEAVQLSVPACGLPRA